VLADLEKLKSNLVANTKTSIYSIVGGVGSNGRGYRFPNGGIRAPSFV
jgi:hypothetical protein